MTKVSLVCIGKFHHFELGRELLKRNLLERIFTGYPIWKLKGEEIPREKIKTYPWLQTPYMAMIRAGILRPGVFERNLSWWAHETLDQYASRNLTDNNILIALSGSGLKCGKEMQTRGGYYICDRGSSHIRYQESILREEYGHWGANFIGIDPRKIAKEEAEYEICDLITVPSKFAYRSFVKMGMPENKLRIIPYGVNTSRFDKVAETPDDQFNVLFVGQVCFRKGIPYLIEAFKLLSHPKKHLTIAGLINSEITRYLSNNRDTEKIELLGHIPQDRLKQYMSRSHVLVLPSIEEGLAMVQAQAMACGCPVIATTNTGGEDLFADGKEGYIVPIRDPKAIAEKMQELADHPRKQKEMSAAAIKRVKKIGGTHTYGEQMAGVIQEIAVSRFRTAI